MNDQAEPAGNSATLPVNGDVLVNGSLLVTEWATAPPAEAARRDRETREALGMAEAFKDAMARFPTGVAIVTTVDEHDTPYGLTVSSFCSVSLDPPLVLVCLARSARCFPVFARTGDFAVSVLRPRHAELALRFADRTAEKFGRGGFARTSRGGVVVDDALATVECKVDRRHAAGDHVILVGEVVGQPLADTGSPAVYFDRRFAAISPAP